jgi:hypothetical protein
MVQDLRCGTGERLGDLEQAEATFRAAESLDPLWPLTMMSVARYASDRGDAGRELTLLRRAGGAAGHELAQRDDGEPDGTLVWFEHVITRGMERIRAHLELRGDELHVHANSEARFERVLATIRALDPSVAVLRETREPAGDVRAVRRHPRAVRRCRRIAGCQDS